MNNLRALDSKTARDGCVPGTLYLQMSALLFTVLWTAGSFLHIYQTLVNKSFFLDQKEFSSVSLPYPVSSSVLLLTKWSSVINPFFYSKICFLLETSCTSVQLLVPSSTQAYPLVLYFLRLSNWYKKSAASYSWRNAALTLLTLKNKFGQCLPSWARDVLAVSNSSTVKCMCV